MKIINLTDAKTQIIFEMTGINEFIMDKLSSKYHNSYTYLIYAKKKIIFLKKTKSKFLEKCLLKLINNHGNTNIKVIYKKNKTNSDFRNDKRIHEIAIVLKP